MNNEDLKCFYNIQNKYFINNVKTIKANNLLTTYCAGYSTLAKESPSGKVSGTTQLQPHFATDELYLVFSINPLKTTFTLGFEETKIFNHLQNFTTDCLTPYEMLSITPSIMDWQHPFEIMFFPAHCTTRLKSLLLL